MQAQGREPEPARDPKTANLFFDGHCKQGQGKGQAGEGVFHRTRQQPAADDEGHADRDQSAAREEFVLAWVPERGFAVRIFSAE